MITELLQHLDARPDIADYFTALEIREEATNLADGMQYRCPVAVYLSRLSGRRVGISHTGGVRIDGEPHSPLTAWPNIERFVNAFDRGVYPELGR